MWNSIAKYVDVVCARVVVSNGVCPSVYGKQNAFYLFLVKERHILWVINILMRVYTELICVKFRYTKMKMEMCLVSVASVDTLNNHG